MIEAIVLAYDVHYAAYMRPSMGQLTSDIQERRFSHRKVDGSMPVAPYYGHCLVAFLRNTGKANSRYRYFVLCLRIAHMSVSHRKRSNTSGHVSPLVYL